jgi:hypothetical protein
MGGINAIIVLFSCHTTKPFLQNIIPTTLIIPAFDLILISNIHPCLKIKIDRHPPMWTKLTSHQKPKVFPLNLAIDKWFEDLSYYEQVLEQMAQAKQDVSFKKELLSMEHWFHVLTDAERTAAMYSLMRCCNEVQLRFFISVMQQMVQGEGSDKGTNSRGFFFLTKAQAPPFPTFRRQIPLSMMIYAQL